jgi:hypothetical protein
MLRLTQRLASTPHSNAKAAAFPPLGLQSGSAKMRPVPGWPVTCPTLIPGTSTPDAVAQSVAKRPRTSANTGTTGGGCPATLDRKDDPHSNTSRLQRGYESSHDRGSQRGRYWASRLLRRSGRKGRNERYAGGGGVYCVRMPLRKGEDPKYCSP